MDAEAIKCAQESEQCMQKILEEHQDELDRFFFDHSPVIDAYPKVKAFIAFAIAQHLALQEAVSGGPKKDE